MVRKICVTLLFRKPYKDFHSIEHIFRLVEVQLKNELEIIRIQAPEYSKGIIPRIKNILDAKKQQGSINHISGDNNYIALGLKTKTTILTIHSFDTVVGENKFKKLIYRLFWFRLPLLKVKYVTVVSNFLKNEIQQYLSISNIFTVVPNPVNPIFKKSNQRTFNKSYPTLLQIGTFPVKNLERVVIAIQDIPCHYRIVGRLSEKQIELLSRYKIDYSNIFDLSALEIFGEYKKTDIVTFVSTYEGFGMPIIEANAVGRVVITSNVAAMPEVAANAAHLVNPLEVKEIKDGILKLIHDDNYRNQLIQNGFENAKRFDVKLIANQYLELYKRVLKNM